MIISMYDVNFGESILYQEGEHKLLVDCGAKFDGRGELAYKRVKSEIDENTDLMITHFDEDHYNGMIEKNDNRKFNKIYLPLYAYENQKLKYTEKVFVDALETWTYMLAHRKKDAVMLFASIIYKDSEYR